METSETIKACGDILPSEILYLIFQLPGVNILGRLCQVCQLFRNLLYSKTFGKIWENLYRKDIDPDLNLVRRHDKSLRPYQDSLETYDYRHEYRIFMTSVREFQARPKSKNSEKGPIFDLIYATAHGSFRNYLANLLKQYGIYEAAIEGAAHGGHLSLVNLYLKRNGDDIGIETYDHVVVAAARGGHLKLIDTILAQSGYTNLMLQRTYENILSAAARHEQSSLIDEMVKRGATNFSDVVCIAYSSNNTKMINTLMQCYIRSEDVPRISFSVVRYGREDHVRKLLARGAPILNILYHWSFMMFRTRYDTTRDVNQDVRFFDELLDLTFKSDEEQQNERGDYSIGDTFYYVATNGYCLLAQKLIERCEKSGWYLNVDKIMVAAVKAKQYKVVRLLLDWVDPVPSTQ